MEIYNFVQISTDGNRETSAAGDVIKKWKFVEILLINGEKISFKHTDVKKPITLLIKNAILYVIFSTAK